MRNRKTRWTRDLIYGAVGGAVGTLALSQVGNLLYKFESEEKKQREEKLRREEPPLALAHRLSDDVLGLELSEQAKSRLGQTIHWGTGIVFGVLYGLLFNRARLLTRAAGLPFGLAFWLLVDEGLNTALKLTPPPREFPVDAHVRGLATHVVYAAAAHGIVRALRKVAG